MAPPRKNVSQATVAAPTASKGKGKAIEAVEPADHQINLSDIHIHDDELPLFLYYSAEGAGCLTRSSEHQ